jgi:hypothetical protein
MPSTNTAPAPQHNLDAETRRRLGLIVARLASPHDGERLAALEAADRVLASHGLGLRELLAGALERGDRPLPRDAEARELLRRLLEREHQLDDWSRRFVRGAASFKRLSERQLAKLAEIAQRAGLA